MAQLTNSLTPKQVSILRYVIDYKTEHCGESPTYREISEGAGVALATVFNARNRFIALDMVRDTGDGTGRFELLDGRWEWLGEDVVSPLSG